MRKRTGERKREGCSGKWKVEVEKTKRERMGYMGIRVWWRKIKRKKRKKKKKRIDDRKKEKKKNDNLEILPQYFYNKF